MIYRLNRLRIAIGALLILWVTGGLFAQVKPEVVTVVEDDTLNVTESMSDSANLAISYFSGDFLLGNPADSLYYYTDVFNGGSAYIPDSARTISTLSPDSLTKAYGGVWSNEILFLFDKDFDPAKMQDSIMIVMQDSTQSGYYPPVPGGINSPFGWRRWQFHCGMDLALSKGDTVRAAFDGVVRYAKWGQGYGNCIIIRLNNGLENLYGHLSAIKVVPNQQVKAGDVIGLGGSTGRSSGPHLHFEVRYKGAPLNPASMIDFENKCLKSKVCYLTKQNFRYVNDVKTVAGSIKYYSVKSGDTLSKIALKTGTSVTALCRLNGISTATILQIGKVLRVR